MTHYKNTQYGKIPMLILLFTTLVLLFIIMSSNKTVDSLPIIIVIAVLGLTFLIFRKLTIVIDDKAIKSSYGLGLITREMLLKDIDLNAIEEVKVPWYYGIGIRITPKGILHNVTTGNAIYIKSNSKLFFVGTDDYSTIKKVLTKLKQ